MKTFKFACSAGLLGTVVTLTGCAIFGQTSHREASSLVQYLYPKGMAHADQPTIPTLSLPLRVGVAWVPGQKTDKFAADSGKLSEQQKIEILTRVTTNFTAFPFVKSIEVIPSAYLQPCGGFANVDQLQSMFGIDVLALVSYDQMQFTSENFLSFAYWTVVGAYLVQGEKNATQTMLDTAVYDIPSRKLLFRAPGTSQVKALATPINLNEELRKNRERGFNEASTNMVANLQEQLASFRQRVKESPQEFNIVRKPGYTGAGAIGIPGLLAAILLSATALLRQKSPVRT
jgi:rhombotail lipoprotein